jgi:hypothetical protein
MDTNWLAASKMGHENIVPRGYTCGVPALLGRRWSRGVGSMEATRGSEPNARTSAAGPVPYMAIHRQFFEPAFLLDFPRDPPTTLR